MINYVGYTLLDTVICHYIMINSKKYTKTWDIDMK